MAKLAPRYQKLHFCHEAGPTGYGLHRWLIDLGRTCDVVAPSLIPKRPGEHVKTNRRDAECLAKLVRADDLTAVWVPDAKHEAVRAREAAGRRPPGKAPASHLLPVASRPSRPWQTFENHAHYLVLQEGVGAVRDAGERVVRIEKAIAELSPQWSLAPVVSAIQAMRGIAFITAVMILAEIGDLNRFDNPRQLMGYLGLTPSEESTGNTIRRGGITKAGNGRVRRIRVDSAWPHSFPARVGAAKLAV